MICMKCMKKIDDTQVCPYCGYIQGTAQENVQALYSGTIINERYILGTVIGSGGFGVTYVGWDKYLKRKVAIKEYFPSNLATRVPGQNVITAFSGEKQKLYSHGKERFIEEARLLMRFAGEEGIVAVYDVLEANNSVYMVMEYVEGITLKESIEKFGVIPEKQLLNFIIPVLLSLKFVHNTGFIHRDISPDNIMCLPDGSVKLIDFGAARYTVMEASQSLSVIVKQGFTPIEQYQTHGKQGAYTDIYSIAATMYKALTGITPEESLERLSDDTLKLPSQCGVAISAHVENAIMTALNVHPENRQQDIDSFIATLIGEETGVVITNHKKNRFIMIAALLSLLLVISGVGGLFAISRDPKVPVVEEKINIVNVPDAIRKQKDDADSLFKNNNLVMIVTGGKLYDSEIIEQGYIEENQIVSQSPVARTEVPINSNVGVVLSKGKKKEYVPSVTDMMGETALEHLNGAGFGDGFDIRIEESYSNTNMIGTVISQSLPEDSAVDFDGTLTLTISLGSNEKLSKDKIITARDYTGEDFEKLKEELLRDQIYLVKAASVYSNKHPYGSIISQSSKVGDTINSGGVLYVVTSLGTELARVPDVLYMELTDAKQTLMKSGLSWKISYVNDPLTEVGLVSKQLTLPGRRVSFGTAVELQISGESKEVNIFNRENVTIVPDNVILTPQQTQILDCTYTGEKEVVWASSNPYIADVDDNGNIVGNHFGAVTVSAAVDGNIATAYVMVEDDTLLTAIDDYTIEPGEKVSLASNIPKNIKNKMQWYSSNIDIATVDNTGLVNAVKEGYTTITGVYKEQIAKCGITVHKEIKYNKILQKLLLGKFDTAKEILLSHNLKYTVEETYNDNISEDNIVKVLYVGYKDNDSFYIQEGSSVGLVRSLGKNTVKALTVKKQPDKSLYFLGEKPVYTGLILEAVYRDGTVTEVTNGYTASSEELTKIGSHNLKITYEGISTYVSINVNTVEASAIDVVPNDLSCYIGETKNISLTFIPENTTDKSITSVSSDPSTVKVNGTQLTAIKAGTATVTVTSVNGKKAVCKVTVMKPSIASVTLSKSTLSMITGESEMLTASITPINADVKQINWSSTNPEIATVDTTGKVTAVNIGTTVITVKTGEKSAQCIVTVYRPSVEKLTLVPSELKIKPKETRNLTVTVQPINADVSALMWLSADSEVANVDNSGKVTAGKAGTTIITAKVGDKSAQCIITVLPSSVDKITVTPSELSLMPTDTHVLKVTVQPKDADISALTWASANDSVAKVDSSGKITAVAPGITNITVSCGKSISAVCEVRVTGTESLKLTSLPVKTQYYLGDPLRLDGLKVLYTDIYGKSTELTDGFVIDNDMNRLGEQKVTVTYKNFSDSFRININEPSIKINAVNSPNMVYISVETEPKDCTYYLYSSDDSIFYIQENSLVSVSSGTADVIASMVYNNIEYSDSYKLTIIKNKQEEELYFYIYLIDDMALDNMQDGERYSIKTNIPDFDIYNVKWSTEGKAICHSEIDFEGNYRVCCDGMGYVVYASYPGYDVATDSYTYTYSN